MDHSLIKIAHAESGQVLNPGRTNYWNFLLRIQNIVNRTDFENLRQND